MQECKCCGWDDEISINGIAEQMCQHVGFNAASQRAPLQCAANISRHSQCNKLFIELTGIRCVPYPDASPPVPQSPRVPAQISDPTRGLVVVVQWHPTASSCQVESSNLATVFPILFNFPGKIQHTISCVALLRTGMCCICSTGVVHASLPIHLMRPRTPCSCPGMS